MAKRSNNPESKLDVPPMSRLFIICNKSNTEEDFRQVFGKFGTIEEVYTVKDRSSGEKKGVCYIKFSKTSEAANALEAMNGKTLGNGERPIKVLVASAKSQGNKRYDDDEERYLRLFVIIPKDMTEAQLRDEFGQYGRVDTISIVRDRQTKEGKGFAYIKFQKFTDIAKAFENCAASYKAVFAEPKPPKNDLFSLSYDNFDRSGRTPSGGHDDRRGSEDFYIGGSSGLGPQDGALTVICSPLLNQEHLWRLFDIIPGLDYARMHEDYFGRTSSASIVYNNLQSAVYAKEKLHGFEYPPGERLIIKYAFDAHNVHALGEKIFNLGGSGGGGGSGASAAMSGGGAGNRESFCSVPLPTMKAMASSNSTCKKRLFIVCVTQALPYTILKQTFCRFGDLIEVFLLPGKTCGYAMYASESAANEAMRTLHGAELYGIRMKVMEAEEPTEGRRKRLRPDEN